jgi:hypothetical protein
MRAILYTRVKAALQPIWEPLLGPSWEDHIGAAGSFREDDLPARPFAVLHLGVKSPGMAHVHRQNAVIWIHDEGGDYGLIDKSLQAVYGMLDGAEHLKDSEGSAELIRAEWTATSGDLTDPGFRTITKNSSYNLVGTGA